jgi:superfamily II DNA or RNA helicase
MFLDFSRDQRANAFQFRLNFTQSPCAVQTVLPGLPERDVAPVGPGTIQQIYDLLTQARDRNDLIVGDILTAVAEGRSPVVITERKDHLRALAERLSAKVTNVIVLAGGMGKKKLAHTMAALEAVPESEERVILATGKFPGEGFDDARLDDLFLTMPISWRGTLAQYAGRLHRLHAAKRVVRIHDYVDEDVPFLAKMATRRRAGYKAIGYDITDKVDLFAP